MQIAVEVTAPVLRAGVFVNTFGAWLRKTRTEKGMTLEEVARKLNTTYVTIQRYETGARYVNFDVAMLLADALSVPRSRATKFWIEANGGETDTSEESEPVEYLVDLDELTPEGYNDFDDLPPQARQVAKTAATQAAKGAYKSVADAIREARRDSPGTVGGAGPVDKEE